MKAKTVTIYALFDRKGVRYVGQTRDLKKRLASHKSGKRKKILRGCECKVIRVCSRKHALRIEAQIINAYHRKNQADLNFNPRPLFWLERGMILRSIPHACKVLGLSTCTLRKHIGKFEAAFHCDRKLGIFERATVIYYEHNYVWTNYEI